MHHPFTLAMTRPTTFLLASLAFAMAYGQVGQDAQDRKVLLEEFTAINCGNCPAGHVAATAILNAHPDEVVLVNMHAGVLAVPSGSQPDFRNQWSTQLLNEYAVNATPRGLVNRRAYNGATVLSTGNWSNAANVILALPAVVNMAATTDFNNGTRLLTVTVELYYTADSPGANDRIFVLLTEDHLNGPQANYGPEGPYASYDHRHVMRAYITAIEGDEVSTTTMGSSVLRTYTLTVPLAFNIANCSVVAFVGEGAASGYGEVHQVTSTPAQAGPTGIAEAYDSATLRAFPVPATDVVTITMAPAADERALLITDAAGRVVKQILVRGGTTQQVISVADMRAGTYRYGFANGATATLVVVR